MSEPILGVIFDCDGTLVDSEPISLRVLVELIDELGHAIEHKVAVARWAGRDLAEVFKEIETEMGKPLPEDFLETFRAHQLARLEVEVQPVPGAEQVLSTITLPFCVASNAPKNKVLLCLTSAGLLKHVPEEQVFSAYDVNAWKPKPDLFLHAAEEIGVRPKNCAVVEDSCVGVQAALSAGMQVFAYDPHEQMEVQENVARFRLFT